MTNDQIDDKNHGFSEQEFKGTPEQPEQDDSVAQLLWGY